MSRQPIQDEYSGLDVSRQRRDQLRHPELYKARRAAWEGSDKGKAYLRDYRRKYRESK